MTFGHPEFLLLLAIPLLIGVWELTRRYPGVAMPFDYGKQRPGRWLERFASCRRLAARRCCWRWRL